MPAERHDHLPDGHDLYDGHKHSHAVSSRMLPAPNLVLTQPTLAREAIKCAAIRQPDTAKAFRADNNDGH
jgi:hypothetical protein